MYAKKAPGIMNADDVILQSELDETQNALQAAQRLSEQLDKKTEAIAALKEEGETSCRRVDSLFYMLNITSRFFICFVFLTHEFLCSKNVRHCKYYL